MTGGLKGGHWDEPDDSPYWLDFRVATETTDPAMLEDLYYRYRGDPIDVEVLINPACPSALVADYVRRGTPWGLRHVAELARSGDVLLAIAEAVGVNGDMASATPEVVQGMLCNPNCPAHIKAMWSLSR